jgi:putative membrane protein
MKPRYFAAAIAVCALTVTGAIAQTNPNPAISTTAANTSATPLPGANSFTENEARNRIEALGFTSVSALQKDDQGIWRGTAAKDGKTVKVALDFKGNVFAD